MIGVDHVAYTYASLNDLFENYAQLKEQGIKPYWWIHHGVTVSMYYADPPPPHDFLRHLSEAEDCLGVQGNRGAGEPSATHRLT